jgi:hypothetical protein
MASAYLRAAHAYMLISMPTDTSTILGAFQAISALLAGNGRESALRPNLMRKPRFASEIFAGPTRICLMLHRNNNVTYLCGSSSNRCPINRFYLARRRHCPGAAKAARETTARDNERLAPEPSNADGPLMPRYFFNTRIGDELIADPEGEELGNADRAWDVARAMIRELLKTEDTRAGLLNAVLEVTDDEGEMVLEFPFAEAILDPSGSRTRH